MKSIQFTKDYASGILTIKKGALGFLVKPTVAGQAQVTIPDFNLTVTVPESVISVVNVSGCRHAVGDSVVSKGASSGVPAGTQGTVLAVQKIGGNCWYRVDFGHSGVFIVQDRDLA